MGLLARHRENRAKFNHAKSRVVELLPLCEGATGIKLKTPFHIERSSRLKHAIRYVIDRLTVLLSRSKVWTGNSYYGSEKMHNTLLGYVYPNRRILGVNLAHYSPGDEKSDYTLAHELVHMLLAQDSVASEMFDNMPVGARRILSEGAATFYGERVIRISNPTFRLTDSLLPDHYQDGYTFFSRMALALGDPLAIVRVNPPPLEKELYNPGLYMSALWWAWHDLSLRIPRPSVTHPLSQERIPLS